MQPAEQLIILPTIDSGQAADHESRQRHTVYGVSTYKLHYLEAEEQLDALHRHRHARQTKQDRQSKVLPSAAPRCTKSDRSDASDIIAALFAAQPT